MACIAGSYLFFLLLVPAAKTVHWLDGEDVIKATNGPTKLMFALQSPMFISLPPFVVETPGTNTDWLRAHVSFCYLSEGQYVRYVMRAYPDLYKRWQPNAGPPRGDHRE
jgi:hypothetical protein